MMKAADIAALRTEYTREELSESTVQSDPIGQFAAWLDEAIGASVEEPTAMVLSTVNERGAPSSRVVLLKGVQANGLVWFTNYASRKGTDLQSNSRAALLFFWPELERQIRIEGAVEKISTDESATYFRSRPYESQIGAWASHQSAVLGSREELHERFTDLKQKYSEGNVPLPPTWGGYVLLPDYFEFWQGRPSRLHDRICYSKDAELWRIERLSP